MKTIGVIGGLGPMATVYYLELLTGMTAADKDQEHPRIFLESRPDIPDRTAYILDRTAENPVPHILEAAKGLQELGAELLTIPCITAHYFYQEIVEELAVPLLHLPRCVAEDAKERGVRQVGILATTGTIQTGVLAEAFAAAGVRTLLPEPEIQKMVMEIIYAQVKKGAPIDWQMFHRIADSLLERGAEMLVLGCTELPLLKKHVMQAEDPVLGRILMQDSIDVLEVLARHALVMAEVPLRAEYGVWR